MNAKYNECLFTNEILMSANLPKNFQWMLNIINANLQINFYWMLIYKWISNEC